MAEEENIEQYNLLPKLAPQLDPHLLFTLLHMVESAHWFTGKELAEAKIATLKKTSMVDYNIEVLTEMGGRDAEVQELYEKRAKVIQQLREQQEAASKMTSKLEDEQVIKWIKQDRAQNVKFLHEEHGIEEKDIQALYDFAKITYETGNYKEAANYLNHYRMLTDDNQQRFSAQMGIVASKVLNYQSDAAKAEIEKLKELLSLPWSDSIKMQVQRRNWFLHWSLFVYWQQYEYVGDLVDLFLQEQNVQTICMVAPWLLRYLAVAVICAKRKRHTVLRELIKLVTQERYHYSDPVTKFIECIYTDYDFEGAQQQLVQCGAVLGMDPFLENYRTQFTDNARQVIFETYCKLHARISLTSLAHSLNMQYEDAEKWIAQLIQQVRLDAKIDSSSGYVVMGVEQSSTMDALIDRSRALAQRSQALA